MTVAELIAELQKMPPHAPVWVQTVLEFWGGGAEYDWEANGPPDQIERVECTGVRWEGNHVEIE